MTSGDRSRFIGDRRGVAALEFAILAPFLIMFVGGILIYGLYFATLHSLQQIVAEAGRASIAGLDDAERDALARAQIDATIASYALLRRDRLTVTAATDPSASDRYTVAVIYDASHLGLNAFGALLPEPPSRIARAAVIRKGGV